MEFGFTKYNVNKILCRPTCMFNTILKIISLGLNRQTGIGKQHLKTRKIPQTGGRKIKK